MGENQESWMRKQAARLKQFTRVESFLCHPRSRAEIIPRHRHIWLRLQIRPLTCLCHAEPGYSRNDSLFKRWFRDLRFVCVPRKKSWRRCISLNSCFLLHASCKKSSLYRRVVRLPYTPPPETRSFSLSSCCIIPEAARLVNYLRSTRRKCLKLYN